MRFITSLLLLAVGLRALGAQRTIDRAPAAERYGYVVLGSYNTLSDGDDRVNIAAVNAMLSGLDGIAADLSRLYIAGMSGTARVGWDLGREMPEHFAGILTASATPIHTDPTRQPISTHPPPTRNT